MGLLTCEHIFFMETKMKEKNQTDVVAVIEVVLVVTELAVALRETAKISS